MRGQRIGSEGLQYRPRIVGSGGLGSVREFRLGKLGWPKSPFSFLHKIKDTVFVFTNNFTDLDILRMSALSHYCF